MLRFYLSLLVIALMVQTRQAGADDFRVETKLFADKEAKQPESTNITYFQQGRVYDFLTRVNANGQTDIQVSIFDANKGKFQLLDRSRKVSVEMNRDRVAELAGIRRARASEQTDTLIKFSADPKFIELAGATTDEMTFSSPVMKYRVVSFAPKSPEAAAQYRDFSDAFARLNAVTNLGSLPPYPRLLVNEALAKKNEVPREVERTILPANKLLGKAIVHRTVHEYDWMLSEADETRIEQAKRWQVEFTPVTFDEFVRPSK
jgi:hypothetical protein